MTDVGSRDIELIMKHTVVKPDMDLINFNVTLLHIWALWSNVEGPPDGYCLTVQHGIDPREAYCPYIFHPGRFDRTLITKALYMFRRVNMQIDVRQLAMTVLKERVCEAVKDKIQNEFKEFVVSDGNRH
ncbi:nuclear pore complex protein Nup160 homolog [Drosophila pseudoobscura]|uniref:Nuclear pore complex protein Nup160 homolog n=1 Tax=Drosophila pseudoobscura pseudoobscura TaxID=46245 RepID=B5DVB1_DROPS|nr:nuclear pore complex protein Nup160 homolog [Drosophila pseudoobscura]